MVPVALNADRLPEGEAGDFFRAAMRARRWPQGIWIVAPDGKVLAFHYFRVQSGEKPGPAKERWTRETLAAVEEGLKAFGPVGPRQPKRGESIPDRGVGLRPAGGARLAVCGGYVRGGRRDGDPVIDSVILSGKEWAAFAPPKAEVGVEWEIPEAVARRFAPALSPITDSIYTPRPSDVKATVLKAWVDRVEGSQVRIRFAGEWASAHNRDNNPQLPIQTRATAEGVGLYDRDSRKMQALLFVFRGTYVNVPPWKKKDATAAVVEWREK